MIVGDYLRILREQWIIIVVAVVLGLGTAAAIFYLRPPTYTANITMYVSSQQGSDNVQQAFQGAQLSQQRVTSYVELVGGRRVSEDVVTRLGLTESPDQLRKQITASSTLESVLIDVAVTDESPERAARLADEVGTVFTGLVDELERPVQLGAPQAVAVRVVQPAAVPDQPSSTGLPTMLAIGLLAGLAVGIAGALARAALDLTVTSLEQLNAVSGRPNLGTIAYDPQVPKLPLTVHEAPQSPRAEAFRQLRTNLQFVDVDTPHKVVVVTSSLPSEGKTTTIANLAITSASAGLRVLVIEADLRRPKLARLLGMDRAVGLTSVLSGWVVREQAIQPWGNGAVDVLASGPLPPNPSEMLGSRQMQMLIEDLRPHYDLILIDTPPLLPVTDAAAVAPFTDGVILVCRFRKTMRTQVGSAVAAVEAVSAPLLGTVFSMVPRKGPRAYAQYNTLYRTETDTGAIRIGTAGADVRRPSPMPRPKPATLPARVPVESRNGRARDHSDST